MIAALALSPAFPALADPDALTPISRETPSYPFAALSRGVEGSVLLEYTVDERGRVVAPRVLEATPSGVFERAALRALSRWRYEPIRSGPKLMKVRLTFQR
jgi:protein TonB